MRENWIEPLVGAVVLLGAGLFLTYLLVAGDARPAPGGYSLTARFGQVGGLREGELPGELHVLFELLVAQLQDAWPSPVIDQRGDAPDIAAQ